MARKTILGNKNILVRWFRFLLNLATITFLCGTIFIQNTQIRKYKKLELKYKEQQIQIDSLLSITHDTTYAK
jgi:low affinity Fe/Cu permease